MLPCAQVSAQCFYTLKNSFSSISDSALFTRVTQRPNIALSIMPMFDSDKIERLQKNQRKQIIANGKAKFVRRELGFSVLFFGMLTIAFYFVAGRTPSALFAGITVFPMGVLGGYLHAIWKWQDLTRSCLSSFTLVNCR